MSNIFFPSLSEDGWVTSYQQIADLSLAHFFESDYSQTQIYFGNVSSFSYILQQYNGNLTETATEVESVLTNYLSSMLNNVSVSATLDPTQNTSSSSITLYVSFTDELNKTITLGNILQVENSKLLKVVKINNG